MQLIERYLQAIQFWLPENQKQDIIAELSEDIHAQIDDRETALGRKLTDAELESFLKQRGRPFVVANRYLPQRFLIGPLLFPVYWFVLKLVALCYLLPWLLVSIGIEGFGGHSWPHAFWHAVGSVSITAAIAFIEVTAVFAGLERMQGKSGVLADWKPHSLPALRNTNRLSRTSSAIELAVNLVLLSWWLSHFAATQLLIAPNLQISLAPVWLRFFWGIAVLTLANASLAMADLLRPYKTRVRSVVRLLSEIAGSVLFCWLLDVNILAGLVAPNLTPAQAADLTISINLALAKSFPAALAICLVIIAIRAYRIVSVKPDTKRNVNFVAA